MRKQVMAQQIGHENRSNGAVEGRTSQFAVFMA